jgi:hypothetical protein
MAERSDIHNSSFAIQYAAVRYLIQAIAVAGLFIKKPRYFGEVS